MKFLYYLAAIGEPNFKFKKDLLLENLKYIHGSLGENFDLCINCYHEDNNEMDIFKDISFLNTIFIHKKKGMLVELWKSNPYEVTSYDYIFFMLDDIKILDLDIHKFISIKNKHSIEILSPKVIGATWSFMYAYDNNIALTNALEIYCLLLTSDDFKKYIDMNDIENTHCWGVDFLFGHFKIKAAINYSFKVMHMLPSNTDQTHAGKLQVKYLNKHGYSCLKQVREKYGEIYKFILD